MKFIEELDHKIKNYYGNYPDQEKRILARTVKLNEEIGELCDCILSYTSFQRKEKLNKKNLEDLEEEFADVIITTMLLAKSMNINIEESLLKKIKKVDKRHK